MAIAGTNPDQGLDTGKIMATFTLSLLGPRSLASPDPGGGTVCLWPATESAQPAQHGPLRRVRIAALRAGPWLGSGTAQGPPGSSSDAALHAQRFPGEGFPKALEAAGELCLAGRSSRSTSQGSSPPPPRPSACAPSSHQGPAAGARVWAGMEPRPLTLLWVPVASSCL